MNIMTSLISSSASTHTMAATKLFEIACTQNGAQWLYNAVKNSLTRFEEQPALWEKCIELIKAHGISQDSTVFIIQVMTNQLASAQRKSRLSTLQGINNELLVSIFTLVSTVVRNCPLCYKPFSNSWIGCHIS